MENSIASTLAERECLLLQKELLAGKFGQPGNTFMSTRALAESRSVSVVTAHNILSKLCATGYLELRGKRYFISHARFNEAKNSHSNIICLLVPQINNEFFSSLSEEVINYSRQKGYTTIVLSTSYSPEEERKAIQLLLAVSPIGIINCVPTPKENTDLFLNCPIPCVMLAHSLSNSKISSVQVNSFSISQKVAQHFWEEGYRKFLYIGTKNCPLEKDDRYTAFQMGLKQYGYHLDAGCTLQMSSELKTDDRMIFQILDQQTEPIGIFCYHDLIAAQVYNACYSLGKRVPEDVGIVGFDDLSVSSRYLSLSTVQYRTSTMAEMAVNLLLTRIKTPNAPYDNYYIEPSLIIRKSSTLSSHR